MAQSQNGWPASPNSSSLDLVTLRLKLRNPNPAASDGLWKVTVARAAAPSFESIIRWWDENIEPVEQLGGYNYREIRGMEGTGVVSNHGSGTAIDINWNKHPWKARDTMEAAKMVLLRAKAATLGLRWGGDYKGNVDEMHFEVPVSPAVWSTAAAAYAAAAKGASALRWVVLAAAIGGGLYYARKKGYLRRLGVRFPRLRRLTG